MGTLKRRITFLCIIFNIIFTGILNGQVLFEDITDIAGLNVTATHGIALGDYDNDGYLDVFFCSKNYPAILFKNLKNKKFIAVTDSVGISLPEETSAATWADFDNDGDLDLFIACFNLKNKFYLNNNGYFEDFSSRSNLEESLNNSYCGVCADFDKDGYLDIYIVNFESGQSNKLFHNNGDNTFSDFTAISNVSGLPEEKSRSAMWGDFNNDGFPDLFVNNQGGDVLYKNNGDSTFSDVTQEKQIQNSGNGYGCSWVDINNNGLLDLIIGNRNSEFKLFLNEDESFLNANSLLYPEIPLSSFAVSTSDYNNDGFVDFYLTNSTEIEGKEYFFENGSEQITNVINEIGIPSGISAHSAAFGDIDNDGDLDLFVTTFLIKEVKLFENKLETVTPNSNWLDINLIGKYSNRSAIGTKVKIVTKNGSQFREKSCGESYISQNTPTIHFGIGNSTSVDSLIIHWPSGIEQILDNIHSNQILNISENHLPTDHIKLTIDSTKSFKNDTVVVNINVNFPFGTSYSSTEIVFEGFQEELNFIEVCFDSSLMKKKNWMTEVNNTDSLLYISAAGAEKIYGSGILFSLKFFAPDTLNSFFIPIKAKSALFDNDDIPVAITNGGVEIIDQIYGDVDLNNVVRAFDASLILKYFVGIYNLTGPQKINADVSLDSTISSLDATFILKYIVGLIDSLPHYGTDSTYQSYGEIAMNDMQVPQDSIIEVPIYLKKSHNIYSFEGKINYDPNFLSFKKIRWSSLLNDFNVETNLLSNEVVFSGAATKPINSDGLFAKVEFIINRNIVKDSTKIRLKNFRFNEGEPVENMASSSIFIIISDIKEEISRVPQKFQLYQNFPNPFNPVTIIKYSIPDATDVLLTIHNINGQLIEELINGHLSPGNYFIKWDASKFSTGVYICRIKAGPSVLIRKMIYLK